ncbi:hypothetical protein BYT27DRAFT_7339756 [Phlegmacium glaucopus]|nr:hypothetical protein BYT27DRAFT_7339756 [Phlegmacium glaucopus]
MLFIPSLVLVASFITQATVLAVPVPLDYGVSIHARAPSLNDEASQGLVARAYSFKLSTYKKDKAASDKRFMAAQSFKGKQAVAAQAVKQKAAQDAEAAKTAKAVDAKGKGKTPAIAPNKPLPPIPPPSRPAPPPRSASLPPPASHPFPPSRPASPAPPASPPKKDLPYQLPPLNFN